MSSFIKIRSPIRKIKIPQFSRFPKFSGFSFQLPPMLPDLVGISNNSCEAQDTSKYHISLISDHPFVSYKHLNFSIFFESPPPSSPKESGSGPVMSVGSWTCAYSSHQVSSWSLRCKPFPKFPVPWKFFPEIKTRWKFPLYSRFFWYSGSDGVIFIRVLWLSGKVKGKSFCFAPFSKIRQIFSSTLFCMGRIKLNESYIFKIGIISLSFGYFYWYRDLVF